ncbi:metallophosphoesterase [Agromyces atrinae]|uniref:LamG-like jellyroll fold domain-containing protein n=1 Tax=Agromyces atrinae TaxID=592376 RepID=UPI001F59BC6D|nr:LamG-like jellyroll fold domain-containing protein [Agromyces atrinae]MCI2959420.1 metallophosphoesterase [Agromyces atrinae]
MPRTTSRRLTRAIAASISVAVALGLAVTGTAAASAEPADAPSDESRSSFILPVLPDTQFYSRYSASQFYPKYGTNPYEVQTKWIVDNKDELKVPFVVHVGDVVDQQWVIGEWDAAEKAMKNLTDGGVTYSIVPGNHDVANQGARSFADNAGNYRSRFGTAALTKQAESTGGTLLGTFQDGLSSAYLFEAEGHEWMSLALAWNASDDTFAWAQGILDAHPDTPVVLSSHAIINIAEDQASPAPWWWGDLLWDQLIRGNDQIILTLNGHFHGATQQTRLNDFGNPVHQILTDYQMAADGGNGIMTLFEFDLTDQKIDVETISPWVGVKAEDARSSSDAPYYTGANQSFSIAFDFAGRFGWDLDPSNGSNGDLSERAKEIVSEGWDGGAGGGELVAAGASNDYVQVDGTIAHWRFGSVEPGVVDENTVIPDIAGESPMYRNAIENTDSPEELEDVTVTRENAAGYSADQASICFTDVSRLPDGPDRLSYITTEYGAPATFADLNSTDGYTIETFLQLDENWTESANRWGAALTRGGSRAWTGINDSSDAGAGVAWLGISNLREYQYSAADSDTANSYTLWSGEIMQGAWHHVAIVNDPRADTAIMYVDGVPVLRNASGVGGMMAADFMPWIIGTSTWDTEAEHGWHGCVGETRVVDHALATSQFLYNRVDIDAQGPNFGLATDLSVVHAPDAEVSSFAGTGYPGAAVRIEHDGEVRGSADVAADGSWTIETAEPFAGSGSYAVSFVQSIGDRDGRALAASVVIGESSEWAPHADDLTPELENVIEVTPNPFTAGDSITISLPAGLAGETTYAFAFSTPLALGAATVSEENTASFSTPKDMALGEHRVALYTADGTVIGWDAVIVEEPVTEPNPGEPGEPGTGEPGTGGPGEPGTGGPGQPGAGEPGTSGPSAGSPAGLAITGISVVGALILAAGVFVMGAVLMRARRARS